MDQAAPVAASIEARVIRRIGLRLLPLLMLGYFVAYVDRVNAGFAALQMNKDVGLSASVFGLGGGIFFLSYCLFEVPSNLALERFGARRWIARIMVTWGLISGAMALTAGPISFVTLRFLLGAAEAGFYPGVILYLTYWYPAEHRARIVAIFMIAIPITGVIGSPISAALLGLNGWFGLRGWQWLFLLEAAPAVILGPVCLAVLRDRPEEASWLTAEEKSWLAAKLALERNEAKRVAHVSIWDVMRDRHVLLLALVWAGSATASAGLSLWQPQFIKSFGVTTLQTGMLNALPFLLSAIAMVLWGRHSDRTGERMWHIALPLGLSAIGLVLCTTVSSLTATMLLLCITLMGNAALRGPFWALTTGWLSAPTAAVGIAQINALATGSVFFTNYLVGVIKDATGSYQLGLLPIATFAVAGTIAVLVVGRPRPARTAAAT